ncbi:MAG TPA: acyl-CoA dehydrogenase family protein [Candidatus Acidoferrum sp.]|nr:acyl-CoA dehydrogenase family protein [Candidatus Acidoferrum sp.]
MDFRPSASQQIVVATARQFLAARCPIELVRSMAWGAPTWPPIPPNARHAPAEPERSSLYAALWRDMAELGWPGLLVPAELGGSGGSLVDVVLLVEEMGRACLPGPFVASAVAATTALVAGGDPSMQKRVLPAMADGDRIATLAVVEERASFDPDAIALACEVPGTLRGEKLFVRDAHLADDLIVAVRGGGDLTLLLVPAHRAGVTRVPLDAGGVERLFAVTFDGVDIRADDVIGTAGRGREPLGAALRAGALARTAEMVGAAQHVLDLTVAHAKTRVQGGRPIGGHQAIQHACADLVRDVDASRGLLYAAAWEAAESDSRSATATPGRDELAVRAEPRPGGETSPSVIETGLGGHFGAPMYSIGLGGPAAGLPMSSIAAAKAYAGDACLRVARRAHQIFGAISYCEEHPLHLFHKRMLAARSDFGDADLHLASVARAIGLV